MYVTYGYCDETVHHPGAGKRSAVNAGRAKRPLARRIARVGREGTIPLRLRQPEARGRRPRGGLHARGAAAGGRSQKEQEKGGGVGGAVEEGGGEGEGGGGGAPPAARPPRPGRR